MYKAILFINGKPPLNFPKVEETDFGVCTEGAYNYLKYEKIKINCIIGDFDSIKEDLFIKEIEVIKIEDQETTDFDKALIYLKSKNYQSIEVYGATGLEHDHFLGNLTTALKFKKDFKLVFYDDYSSFYFTPKKIVLKEVQGKIISLYPFPKAKNITTKGLEFPLYKESLALHKRIGTRNKAIQNEVEITYEKGELIVFIQK